MTEQEQIIDALGVAPSFDVTLEARRRIDFLGTYLRASALSAYVLGISGGVDFSCRGPSCSTRRRRIASDWIRGQIPGRSASLRSSGGRERRAAGLGHDTGGRSAEVASGIRTV